MADLPVFDTPVLWLAVLGLAIWRITAILHQEEIARPLRVLAGIEEKNGLQLYPDTFFGKLLSCFWCLSIWVSFLVFGIGVFFPYIFIPFSLSTVAIIIETKILA